jgi:hypothetical protein
MATQLQIRRGTAAQVAAFTGAEGEIVYNSTNDSLHTNDGATAGGFELARADLNNVSDANLNAALTGNTLSALTITTLTAGAATFSGNVGIGIAPDANGVIKLDAGAGSNTNIYFSQAGVGKFFVGHVTSSDAFRIYDVTAAADRLTISSTGAATFSGDVNVSGANPDNILLSQLSVKSTAALANGNASGISFWANTSTGLGSYASIQTVTTGDYAGKLVFTTRNGAGVFDPRMTIDASGKIQIGNNIPIWSGQYGGALFLKGNNATGDRYAQLAIVDSAGSIAQQGLIIDNSGNVGIGFTPSAGLAPWKNLEVGTATIMGLNAGAALYLMSNAYYDGAFKYKTAGQAGYYSDSNRTRTWGSAISGSANGAITWVTDMVLDASGNLTVSNGDIYAAKSNGNSVLYLATNTTTNAAGMNCTSSGQTWLAGNNFGASDGRFSIYNLTGNAERFSIGKAGGGIICTTDSTSFSIDARQTGTNGYGILSRFSAAGLGYMYSAYLDSPGAYKFYVTTDGSVYGSGIYGSVSDIKLKENIAAANSQWDDIKAVQLKNYSLIADNLDHADQLGVIAQDLEASGMGKLIDTLEDIDGDGESLGTVTKHVKYSVLHLKALGALQEAMTRIETLEARLEAIEGA